MRKVTVELKVVLEVEIEGYELDSDKVEAVLSEMDYSFKAAEDAKGSILESEIIDWGITGGEY